MGCLEKKAEGGKSSVAWLQRSAIRSMVLRDEPHAMASEAHPTFPIPLLVLTAHHFIDWREPTEPLLWKRCSSYEPCLL